MYMYPFTVNIFLDGNVKLSKISKNLILILNNYCGIKQTAKPFTSFKFKQTLKLLI